MDIGFFSLSLKSLQAQVDGLLDGVGGLELLPLLDELAKLDPIERSALIKAFTNVACELVDAHQKGDLDNDGNQSTPVNSDSDLIEHNDCYYDGSSACNIERVDHEFEAVKQLLMTHNNDRILDDSNLNEMASRLCDEILTELSPEGFKKCHLQVVPGGKNSNKVVKFPKGL